MGSRAKRWWEMFLDVGVSLAPVWIIGGVLAAVGIQALVGLF